jgi:anti-sigma factor RsiW
MQHSHLQPDEIDLLLDGDEGFAVFPLRKHIESCDACRAELEHARAVVSLVEHLPHLPASPRFADAVMRRVHINEPWHVTLADTARRWVPRSGPYRVLATAGAGGAALSLTAFAVWLSLRIDFAVYAGQLGLSRVESAMASSASAFVANAFGDQALTAVRDGGLPVIVIGVSALLGVLAGAAIGLRGLIGASRRRGN